MSPDFRDLLSTFNDHHVEYLVVGAHALAAHGHVRATKDLDVWVRPESANAERVWRALAEFGAPLHDLSVDDLSHPGIVFQMGVPPLRIDVLTRVSGMTFEDAWSDKEGASFGGIPAFVLSRRALVLNKKASGRMQDLADVEWLEKGGPV